MRFMQYEDILDVRINENLMHTKDKPKLVFLPEGFTARAMQHFRFQVVPSLGYVIAMFPIVREVVRWH